MGVTAELEEVYCSGTADESVDAVDAALCVSERRCCYAVSLFEVTVEICWTVCVDSYVVSDVVECSLVDVPTDCRPSIEI